MMRSELNFPMTRQRVWYIIRQLFSKKPAVGKPALSTTPPTFVPQPQESTDMQYAKLSHAQATTLRLARGHASDADRKGVKKEIYAAVKEAFGIPATTKLTCEVDPSKPNYGILRMAKTPSHRGFELDPATGRWNGAAEAARVHVPSSWFCLPADKLKQALIDAIETVMDGHAETYETSDLEALGAKKLTGGALDVALDDSGNAYVYLPDDQFESDSSAD
jgi:hypothetical protein